MLHIEPRAGLCNRMRALDSALHLARVGQVPLRVVWFLNDSLYCPFEDLFERPELVSRVDTIDMQRASHRLYRKAVYTWLNRRRFAPCLYQDDVQLRLDAQGEFEGLAAQNAFFSTFTRFFTQGKLFADFRPIPSLQSQIDQYASRLDDAVGIHIRRGDHVRAIAQSPTSLFISAMHAELIANPSATFFLATDSPHEEETLRAEFGDRLLTHPKASVDRQEPRAIQDALIDLYTLAQCRKIIGSAISSFSETAAQINGAALEIVSV